MVAFKPRNDAGYYQWLRLYPDGFILNIRSTYSPKFLVLHRADCRMISKQRDSGVYTEHSQRKVCAETKMELIQWIKDNIKPDGYFTNECSICHS